MKSPLPESSITSSTSAGWMVKALRNWFTKKSSRRDPTQLNPVYQRKINFEDMVYSLPYLQSVIRRPLQEKRVISLSQIVFEKTEYLEVLTYFTRQRSVVFDYIFQGGRIKQGRMSEIEVFPEGKAVQVVYYCPAA